MMQRRIFLLGLAALGLTTLAEPVLAKSTKAVKTSKTTKPVKVAKPLKVAHTPNKSGKPVKKAEKRSLKFLHLHTGEECNVVYHADGKYNRQALQTLNHLLRDHRTGQQALIDPRLFDYLHELKRKTGNVAGTYEVFCGYRSPLTNTLLRQTSTGVAKNSLHLQGRAVDIRMPGMDLHSLSRLAMDLEYGGVGYYRKTGFVHLDTGDVRFW